MSDYMNTTDLVVRAGPAPGRATQCADGSEAHLARGSYLTAFGDLAELGPVAIPDRERP